MRSNIAIAVLASIATVSANDYPEVSRLGKNILLLEEVQTSGFTTPRMLYNKTLNATEEPRFREQLTPLG